MEQSMSLIVQIKKKLGKFRLFVDVAIENEIFAILGSSGSGKSMTLKCIAGIETPDEGKIVLNGRVVYDSKKQINLPPQKRKVGYLFQDYALFPNMTVTQNIMAGMGKRPNQNQVRDLIIRFHLTGLEQHYPEQLSGGQKQRVALARMIASEPDTILLDEPFSALDTYLRWEMEMEMRKLLEEVQKPVIFVSHNRNEVYRLCQIVSCMEQGNMEEPVLMQEFFKYPKTKAAAILSGCKNISKAERKNEHLIFATDWKVMLTVKEKIPDDIAYVGIRAHNFKRDEADNRFSLVESRIIEEPFEWNVSFRTSKDSEWIQWKTAKQEERSFDAIPEALYVRREDILLLR